jgi:(S)-ureidoglycine aminohydrolase
MKTILYITLSFIALSSAAQDLKPVASSPYRWADFPVKVDGDRESRAVLEGTCPHFKYFQIHVTTQKKGAKPKAAHANENKEELILIKEGRAKFTVGTQTAILGPASAALILPQEMHQIENVGDGPLTYYVIQLQSEKPVDIARGKSNGGSLLLNKDSLEFKPSARGGGRAYFNRPTAMCENFEMHVTRLDKKGPSHAPHSHEDNEILLAIEGDTEMNIDSKQYPGKAGDLYFINSQVLHGAGNAVDAPCMYFAIRWR